MKTYGSQSYPVWEDEAPRFIGLRLGRNTRVNLSEDSDEDLCREPGDRMRLVAERVVLCGRMKATLRRWL